MSWVLFHLVWMLLGAAALSLVLAPMESLGWWAGWLGPEAEDLPDGDAEAERDTAGRAQSVETAGYLVYVSGIGSISGTELLPAETDFLDRLQAEIPGLAIVRDVFPYAPSGRPLMTGQRAFAWFWRRVERWRISGTYLLPAVLNLRNLFQVLVSADRRYGPLYSFAMARIVLERLGASGYRHEAGVPVVLFGISGGAQISAGAATYLAAALDRPPALVTLGGVMAADRGLDAVASAVSLYGSGDRVYRLGRAGFPGRWPAAMNSPWNQAAREGRLEEHCIGTMGHTGRGGYLDPRGGEAASNLDVTLREVAAALRPLLTGGAVGGGAA